MKNIVIITPVYNDWESFTKLINEINKVVSSFKEISFKLIAINDGSEDKVPKLSLPINIETIEILNMKINQGHAICLANGIKYALKNYQFDSVILMDADGEDRPEEIFDLINEAKKFKNLSIVAKRVKRSEGPIFKIFYSLHKILTLIFTGKLINFGNYSLITNNDADTIIKDPTIVYSFSGGSNGVNVSGLPNGLIADVSNGVVTISGTHNQTGVYDFIITTIGSNQCNELSAKGSLEYKVCD